MTDHSKSADKLRNMGMPMFEPYKDQNQVFKNMGFYAKAFPLDHNGTENRGIYLMTPSGEKIIYATDFEFIRYKFGKLGINHFILECNHMDDIDKGLNEGKYTHVLRGHSSLSVVKEFLKVNKTDKLKTVILCHLSDTNSNPTIMQNEVQEIVGEGVKVFVAERGMKIHVYEQIGEKEAGDKAATCENETHDRV